jgi:hypothetical protein
MSTDTTTTSMQPALRELSRRTCGGKLIALVWDASRDAVILFVDDLTTGDRVRVAPTRGRERFAFEHPIAYLSTREVRGC